MKFTERRTGNGVATLIDGNRNAGLDVHFELDATEVQSGLPGLPLRSYLSFYIGKMSRLDKGVLDPQGVYELVGADGVKYKIINSGAMCSADLIA